MGPVGQAEGKEWPQSVKAQFAVIASGRSMRGRETGRMRICCRSGNWGRAGLGDGRDYETDGG